MRSKKIAISVKNVYKSFRLPHEKSAGLKQAIIKFRPGKKYEVQQVLKDISFDIVQGEFFGIVGRNGSGKSTLLKILAQIYTPNSGGVIINGSLTPFIELGVGFNPELTGRENVFLNGALLGFDREQMNAMYGDIVEFAELHEFMDQKLKNYSSGMQVRLAFSVAIRAQSDILLIDEVLAVGDAAFQQKCFRYFDRLKQEKRTIVLVTHDMGAVKQFCDRALLITEGKIELIDDPVQVALAYDKQNYNVQTNDVDADTTEGSSLTLSVMNEDNHLSSNFEYGKPIHLEVTWPKELNVGIAGFVVSKGTEVIFAANSSKQDVNFGGGRAQLRLEAKLGNGRYRVAAGLFGKSEHDSVGSIEGGEILIYGQPNLGIRQDRWEGLIYIQNKWID